MMCCSIDRSGTVEQYTDKIKKLDTASQLKHDAEDRMKALKAAKIKEKAVKKITGDLRLVAMRASKAGECAWQLSSFFWMCATRSKKYCFEQ